MTGYFISQIGSVFGFLKRKITLGSLITKAIRIMDSTVITSTVTASILFNSQFFFSLLLRNPLLLMSNSHQAEKSHLKKSKNVFMNCLITEAISNNWHYCTCIRTSSKHNLTVFQVRLR